MMTTVAVALVVGGMVMMARGGFFAWLNGSNMIDLGVKLLAAIAESSG